MEELRASVAAKDENVRKLRASLDEQTALVQSLRIRCGEAKEGSQVVECVVLKETAALTLCILLLLLLLLLLLILLVLLFLLFPVFPQGSVMNEIEDLVLSRMRGEQPSEAADQTQVLSKTISATIVELTILLPLIIIIIIIIVIPPPLFFSWAVAAHASGVASARLAGNCPPSCAFHSSLYPPPPPPPLLFFLFP